MDEKAIPPTPGAWGLPHTAETIPEARLCRHFDL